MLWQILFVFNLVTFRISGQFLCSSVSSQTATPAIKHRPIRVRAFFALSSTQTDILYTVRDGVASGYG